jgi:mono/diheme cytochrome c family protein
MWAAAAGVAASQQPRRTTSDGVFTRAQAERGEALYRDQCASCHGARRAGAGAAPPLAGPAFFGTWAEVPVADLFERIRLSMPQDKPGTLGRQQTADIVAYMLSFNKAPAGQTELPGELEALKLVRIVFAAQ